MTDDRPRIEYNGMQVLASWPEEVEKAQKITHCRYENTILPRVPHRDWDNKPCHDCAVLPRQLHVPGCDDEACPNCGGQALSCPCQGNYIIENVIERSKDMMNTWDERLDDQYD